MNGVRTRAALLLAGIGLVAVLGIAGCNSQVPTPTATYAWPTAKSSLVASATVNPVMPTGDGMGGAYVGASNPTQAALAAEGQPAEDEPTITPLPTQAEIPMSISARDGLALHAAFYGVSVRPAPGVLLFSMQDGATTPWDHLAQRLQAVGYNVLVVDVRGYGETGGQPDWTKAPDDARIALGQLGELPGVAPGNLIAMGADVGANLALNACADIPGCVGAVLLSPGLDYHSITTAPAITRMGQRPVLIAASENDSNNPADSVTLDNMAAGDHKLLVYPDAGHGADMFAAEPGLADAIVEWMQAHVSPPPTPVPTPES